MIVADENVHCIEWVILTPKKEEIYNKGKEE